MAIAAVTALVVISAAGAYLGGFLSFQSGIADSPTPRLSPGQSKPPPAEDAAGGQGSAGEAAQQPPAEKPTAPAGANPATRPQAAPPKQPEIVTEHAKPSTKPAEVASSAPPATNTARPATQPDVAKDGDRDATSSSGAKPATSQASPPPKQPARVAVTQPAAQGTTPPASQFPKSDAIAAPPADGGGDGDATKQAPAANTSPASNAADIAKALSQQFDEQQGNAPGGTDVAINLPRPKVPPSLPPPASNRIAERISWLRAYQGGDCFYATATSMTDKAAEIEGFGTAAEPFVRMMGAFQARFDIEPDISVRLIDPAQCEVTHFLGVLGAPAPEKPKLTLDHTSVPSGSPISGTLETQGGLRTSLLLIDHKGMAFSLDDRVVVQGGKATFNVPIGLAAADRAAGKAVPQIIVAVTGASDIEAATFANAMPASTLLPRILAEISKKPTAFSATAKYFQLGN
jgi:serine/threonine-protein kinase